jgi:hypothetical protein
MSKVSKTVSPRCSAAAPFSPAAVNLIAQVQAEAREQLLNELSAKGSIIVLHGFDVKNKHVRHDGNQLAVTDRHGNGVTMHRGHQEPEGWVGKAHMKGHWNPARWFGQQTLVDACGNEWTRQIDPHVCDDFGNLVKVPA